MRKLIYLAILSALPVFGCAKVSVDAPSICDSRQISKVNGVSITGLPSVSGSTSYSHTVSFTSALSKIHKLADVSFDLLDFSIKNNSGDMSWINSINVYMIPRADIAFINQSEIISIKSHVLTPEEKASSTLNLLPLNISSMELYDRLRESEVTFYFDINGATTQYVPNLDGNLCVHASATSEKSLSDLTNK
jgi:hypothetical protein